MKNESQQPSLEFMGETPLDDSHGSIEVREIGAEGIHEPITEVSLRAAVANLTNRTWVKKAGKIHAENGARPGEYIFAFWDDLSKHPIDFADPALARFMPKGLVLSVFSDEVQKQCNELLNPKAANSEAIPHLQNVDTLTADADDDVVGHTEDGRPIYRLTALPTKGSVE